MTKTILRWATWGCYLGLGLAAAWPGIASGSPPLLPLSAPDYSFDLASPTAVDGFVSAGDILNTSYPYPLIVLSYTELGLVPADELDALSGANSNLSPDVQFALLFSVSRTTVGLAPPAPELVEMGIPYNVLDQNERGHAGGDEFGSTELYTTDGKVGAPDGGVSANNFLTRNNFDEGGTDHCALPPCSAASVVRVGTEQDNVACLARLERLPDGQIARMYFSLAAGSPYLSDPMSGIGSGADILLLMFDFVVTPSGYLPPSVYAHHYQLGLEPNDDIDALVVIDVDENGSFDGSDVVLFSLAPGSPSLETIAGHSTVAPAADVFVVQPGQPPELFAAAAELGLGAAGDDVDALDLYPVGEERGTFAGDHGIRLLRGDLNCDGLVNTFDIDPFVLAMTSPATYATKYPDCDAGLADVDQDGWATAFDIDAFVAALAGY